MIKSTYEEKNLSVAPHTEYNPFFGTGPFKNPPSYLFPLPALFRDTESTSVREGAPKRDAGAGKRKRD